MKRPLSPEEEDQLQKLVAMSDDDIDTSDIPETTDEQWRAARRGSRPVKRPVTIRLDGDVIDWFKSSSEGKPYQSEINRVLRQYVDTARKRA